MKDLLQDFFPWTSVQDNLACSVHAHFLNDFLWWWETRRRCFLVFFKTRLTHLRWDFPVLFLQTTLAIFFPVLWMCFLKILFATFLVVHFFLQTSRKDVLHALSPSWQDLRDFLKQEQRDKGDFFFACLLMVNWAFSQLQLTLVMHFAFPLQTLEANLVQDCFLKVLVFKHLFWQCLRVIVLQTLLSAPSPHFFNARVLHAQFDKIFLKCLFWPWKCNLECLITLATHLFFSCPIFFPQTMCAIFLECLWTTCLWVLTVCFQEWCFSLQEIRKAFLHSASPAHFFLANLLQERGTL